MRLKSRHITIVTLVSLAMFFGLAYLRQAKSPVDGAVVPAAKNTEDAFIEEAQGLQRVLAQGEETKAALPPAGESQDDVAVIELETVDLDLGVIANFEIAKRSLKVFNRGRAELSLINVRTTCPCTLGVIPDDGRTIAPGGEGRIDILVNPAKIHGFESSKTLVITSNDPKNPQIGLIVRSKLNPEFIVDPPDLNFGTLQKGEIFERTILIRQNTPDDFSINEATLTHPGEKKSEENAYTVTLKAKPEAEWQKPGMKEYEVHFKSTPMMPLGAFKRYFYLTTNLRRIPFYAYKVEGKVESFYTLEPSIPNALSLVRPEGSLEKVTKVATLQSEQAITVSDLKYDEQFLDVVVRPGDKPGVVYLEVSLKPVAAGELDKRVDFVVKGQDKTLSETVVVKIFGSGTRNRGL